MEENKEKRTGANDVLRESEPEVFTPDSDTIVFHREPAVPRRNTTGQPQNTARPSPKRPSTPVDMQHTAQIQGGAVIRPLKKAPTQTQPQQTTVQRQPTSQRPMNSQQVPQRPAQQSVQRPAQTQRPVQQTTQQSVQRPVQQNVQRPAASGTPKPAQGSAQTPAARSKSVNLPIPHTTTQVAEKDFEIDEATYSRSGRARYNREAKKNAGYSYAADSASSAIMSLVKAMVYIVVIIAVSIALAVFVIRTANDVFKFVVDEKIVTVDIPEYATISDVADALYEAGAIEYKWAFNLWSNLKENSENPPNFIAGTYEISTTLNYDYLRSAFKKKTGTRTEVRITIPEGATVDEIIDRFLENGIGTREGFVEAINNYDFDYPFLAGLEVSEDRIYRLEGYLFPDTYNFYQDSSEVAVLTKLLDNFNRKFVSEYYDRCTDLGITIDEAIILASMVEKEARYADELGDVSSVFHNRLTYSSTFPYLNSDATIMYAIQHDTGSRLDTMTGEDTSYDSPYNTYTHKGLPPGPIANPGLNSIKYALYPNDTDYFYFVSDSSGRMLFAETYAEHEKNIITARSR